MPSAAKNRTARKGAGSKKKTVVRTAANKESAERMVYFFGAGKAQGKGACKSLLGGKGVNLAEMTRIGLPVPPGMTVTTETCALYYKRGQRLPAALFPELRTHMAKLERVTGKRFGSDTKPLLVSVRSGAAVSMPGMMDTILNLGITDTAVEGLAEASGDRRFAFDAYRRLISMFGDVAMGVPHGRFHAALEAMKASRGATQDADLSAEALEELCDHYKGIYEDHVGAPFPQEPEIQLGLAIKAVFASWNTPRAVSYRRINGITGLLGTAVSIQAMVFGNMGPKSGTGVAFTRDPSTGRNAFYGEFLVNAQGEDVVAGIRTPRPVSEMARWNRAAHRQLMQIRETLEQHYGDMQDIEFTIEEGELFMLQTRSGKRTGTAAVKIACDMVKQGLITEQEALMRVPADALTQLLLPSFDLKAKSVADVLVKGLPASPGAIVGKPAFTTSEAVERARAGESVVLVRRDTSPEDIEGMHAAAGILTTTGGMTSHAAVVARGWGKCCVVGAGEIRIDEEAGVFTVHGKAVGREDTISLDGATGEVLVGSVQTTEPRTTGDFAKLMRWANEHRTLCVRANADTPADAARARGFGAEGIGLTRTEHMFFEGDRILAMREMILAETAGEREVALAKLLPHQRADFVGIFTAMKGLPVTIRLLDPPLHEFLPASEEAVKSTAKQLGISRRKLQQRVGQLHEMNPMLGHRGCRLAVTYPEIVRMQVRAIVEAALDCAAKRVKAVPEIMIPLVGTEPELRILRDIAEETIHAVCEERRPRSRPAIPIGTMIEIPRAALAADTIAGRADFFSFGTNDLTQMTFGYSRDDVSVFLPEYIEREILVGDPFQSIDVAGVGQLVRTACEKGRRVKRGLKLGVCGEHGGDPASIRFFHRVGLDYVSCSPFRTPVAILAAAQAAIEGEV